MVALTIRRRDGKAGERGQTMATTWSGTSKAVRARAVPSSSSRCVPIRSHTDEHSATGQARKAGHTARGVGLEVQAVSGETDAVNVTAGGATGSAALVRSRVG